MPLPHEKPNLHRARVNGYLQLGNQKPVYNENRRLIGKKFVPKYGRVPFLAASLTGADLSLLGNVTISQISKKVDIAYSAKIESEAENTLLVLYNGVVYDIVSTDRYQDRLYLYLVTTDDKGGNIDGE
jgi:hypothetical protein|nr:MAG TPA: hypothetical protein [Caudoviricetes sp.]